MSYYCSNCKCNIDYNVKDYSLKNFGCPLCKICQKLPKYTNSRTDPNNDYKLESFYDKVSPEDEESFKGPNNP